jgi:hypothetical protein
MTLRIDARYLEEQLEALTGVPIRRPLAFALAMPTVDGAGSFLERICHFLVAETERVGLAFDHPLMRASLGEAVARALLLGQPHDHAHLLERRAPASSQAVVRLVEEYVDALLVVLLYASVGRDESGRPVFEPRPANCREALLGMVRQDLDMATKLDRHLKSADASIKARLDEA